jgi:NAD(P)-dependent dehydrogenase (short-subunit alcohol dehydrogenase family)
MSAADGAWWEGRANLRGTVSAIVGGAGGLGAQISLDLSAVGVSVAILDRDDAAVDELQRQLAGRGADALLLTGDARNPEELESLFTQIDGRWGRLDTLVNVVGGTFKAPFSETNQRGWDAVLRMNLGYALHSCALAIPRIRAGGRGGSIINLTTIEAHRAAPNFAVYAGAKAGLANFSRSLAVELAADGIRVNTVAPDMTPTPRMLADPNVTPVVQDELGARVGIPMGRFGDPRDVAGCVVFLASGLASYVTGTTLHPDGGTWASSGWFNWPGEGYLPTPPRDVLDQLRDPG